MFTGRSRNHSQYVVWIFIYALIIRMLLLSLLVKTSCRETIDSEGVIYSPNFPGFYPHNQTCRTLIKAPNDMVINFIIFDFEILCNDSAVLYDGSTESSPVLNPLDCGSLGGNRAYLQSSGQNALLVFQSDESKADIGFRILTQFRPGNTPFIGFRILTQVRSGNAFFKITRAVRVCQ